MVVSIFNSCTEACGWVAAVTAVLSFGSFGVPIKHVKSEVHPLVMQSYKTLVCFLTCWFVVLLGEEVRFSYYGILSGLFWVPGASCGVYAIRNAGLAVAVGTWSSIIVMTSFIFGIIVFKERVKHFVGAMMAFGLLIVGLMGMAKYAGMKPPPEKVDSLYITTHLKNIPADESPMRDFSSGGKRHQATMDSPGTHMDVLEIEPLMDEEESDIMAKEKDKTKDRIVLFGGRLIMTRHQLGVLGAVINGTWGGMNLIPMHYAKKNEGLSGAGYLISYACGALIVNTLIWVFYFLYYLYHTKTVVDAFEALPNWNLNELLLPGLGAGILYSIGNFSSLLAVTYLGQGTGFSFCQMQLFISGLWGVLFFREIRGAEIITKWFLSAGIAVLGIIWLSYEHEGGTGGH